MAKQPTFASIRDGVNLAASETPLPHLEMLSRRWSPLRADITNGLIGAMHTTAAADLKNTVDLGYAVDDSINPIELLAHTSAMPTHPTVQRWLRAIALAAEEDRFK